MQWETDAGQRTGREKAATETPQKKTQWGSVLQREGGESSRFVPPAISMQIFFHLHC